MSREWLSERFFIYNLAILKMMATELVNHTRKPQKSVTSIWKYTCMFLLRFSLPMDRCPSKFEAIDILQINKSLKVQKSFQLAAGTCCYRRLAIAVGASIAARTRITFSTGDLHAVGSSMRA
jgi:hypothetical protein